MGTRYTQRIAAICAVVSIAALLLGTGASAFAQVTAPGAPRNVTATWTASNAGSTAKVVVVKWLAPEAVNARLLYYIYAAKGATDNANADGWKLVRISDGTSATFTLTDLGIDVGQTMSFKIQTLLKTDADSVFSTLCGFGVAKWATVVGDAVRFTTEPVKTGTAGVAYRYECKATAADASAITYSVVGPDGMTIDATTGVVTWTPRSAGTYNVTVKATSANGATASQVYMIVVTGGDVVGGAVTGTITDTTTGKGINGATVYFMGLNSNDAFKTITGDNGNYKINLPPGSYRVKVVKDGYVVTFWYGETNGDKARVLTVEAGATYVVDVSLFPVKKAATGFLFGKVVDAATGKGIPKAKVTVILKGTNANPPSSDVPGYGTSWTAYTDADGIWSIQVPEGSYIVRAEGPGYNGLWADNAREMAQAKMFGVAADQRIEVNIALTGAPTNDFCTIAGNVFGGNQRLANAKVIVASIRPDAADNNSAYSVTLLTNNDGHWTASVPCNLVYIAYAEAVGYVGEYWDNQQSPLDAKLIKGGQDGINFELGSQVENGSGVTGVVYACDSLNVTVAGKVTAYIIGENSLRAVATVYTDDNGAYTFKNLDTGVYLMQAMPKDVHFAPGYYTEDHSCSVDWHNATRVHVVAGQVLTGYDIYSKATLGHRGFAKLKGRVKVFGGAPVETFLAGAMVYATDTVGNIVGFAQSDTSGAFEIDNVEVGTYTLTIDKLLYATYSQVVLTADYDLNAAPSGDVTAQKQSVSAVNDHASIPSSLSLEQNYPNPFNPTTQITFAVPTAGVVNLAVYAVTGQKVATLAAGMMSSGTYHVTFDASLMPSGTYVYRLETAQGVVAKRMVELK